MSPEQEHQQDAPVPPAFPHVYSSEQSSPHQPAPPPVPPVSPNTHFSSRGAEYAIFTISLWFASASLAWLLVNVINGGHSFDYLVAPISILITSLPIFAFMFIRLRKAELGSPELKQDVSRRRWIHFTQILAFLTCLINLATFVYVILQHFGSNSTTSIPKAFGSLMVVLVVAGGILAYYWSDSRKKT